MSPESKPSGALLLASGLSLMAAPWTLPLAAQTRWPERIAAGEVAFTLYQPQPDRWADDRLEARAAVTAVPKGAKDPTYGVVWLKARTAFGRLPGQVTFEEIELVRASFPWERDGGKDLFDSLRRSAGTTATIPVPCLNASPAAAAAPRKEPVKASPPEPGPRVINARGPTILVLVDGSYVIRPVPGATSVLRVENARALLLQDAASSRFYLPVGGSWLVAPAPNAKWKIAKKVPQGLESVRKAAAAEGGVELFERPGEEIAALLRAGKVPAVIVSTTPAVLASKLSRPEKNPPPPSPATRPGGLFAGVDGNVYRPRPGGGWEKTNGRDWYPTQERAGGRSAGGGLIERLEADLRARGTCGSSEPSSRARP